MQKRVFVFLIILLFLPFWSIHALNILSVQDPDTYGSKPGYIDKATLVVEPHGSHTEQSLYLEYSDHGQYAENKQIEVVHRFELPTNSVINDMWLWIGDSVMQAIMLDTWTARAIYDSIVGTKRDPAFLTKKGSQYELHIFPLTPGSFRKVKINFITPTRWVGNVASISLPLKMLKADNNDTQLLEILYRYRNDIWSEPKIFELLELQPEVLADTMDYHYQHFKVDDIKALNSLTLTVNPDWSNGLFAKAFQVYQEPLYYQLGIQPAAFFDLDRDSTAKKVLVGLDYSSAYYRNLDTQIPVIKTALCSLLQDKDSFYFRVVGAGESLVVSDSWLPGTDEGIEGVLNEFQTSELADTLSINHIPHIVYTDNHAKQLWTFPGIEGLATMEYFSDIMNARESFADADIIAAYDHGYENIPTDTEMEELLQVLGPFFNKGGWFLTFFDYNRNNGERLASHYIPGLKTTWKFHGDLYRNPDGLIGQYFPESFYHPVNNCFEYNDPDVNVEMVNKNGDPVVITKRIGNGLLVVSGMWSFQEDGALRAQLGIPLLGLNSISSDRNHRNQLIQLLSLIQADHTVQDFDQVILFSNSDSLIDKVPARQYIENYLNNFTGTQPVFHTINMIDGSTIVPAYLTENNEEFYGSGYLLNVLSGETGGLHFETHVDDWDYIASMLAPGQAPKRESVDVQVTVDNGSGDIVDLMEVDPSENDPNKPWFFIGSADGAEQLDVTVIAEFAGDEQQYQKTVSIPVSHDTTQAIGIIPSMLGFEKLNQLFENASYDTSAIVQLAMKYNLLCDYTALLALEPNDTLHFMKDPFDESGLTFVEETEVATEQDSVQLDIFPNPFNARTTIQINVPRSADIDVKIFNIRGQLVKELYNVHSFTGKAALNWNSTDERGLTVSSGIYFVQIVSMEKATGKTQRKIKRLLLLR